MPLHLQSLLSCVSRASGKHLDLVVKAMMTSPPSFPGTRASDGGGGLDVPGKGDTCQNGPTPPFPDSSSSLGPPTSPGGPDASPGVAGFHDNLRKSQGTSAEGSVRKEALQSLRLSLPMQETQLCKHLFPPGSSLLSPTLLPHPL